MEKTPGWAIVVGWVVRAIGVIMLFNIIVSPNFFEGLALVLLALFALAVIFWKELGRVMA